MRINYILASLLVIFIVAIAGCTSPSPTPSPSATVAPTATESATPIANASPSATATVNASPTATAAPSATVTTAPLVAGNLSVSDVSIDWDTTDTMQHDTAHLKVKNVGQYMILDVNVLYSVTTPGIIVNPDNSSYTQNQTYGPVTVQVGKLNAGEARDVTVQSPDHKKNVPAYITINVSTREGTTTVFQGMLNVSDHAVGTETF